MAEDALTDLKVVGWNNRQTSRPTSFMMTTKFVSAIVIRTAERRFLAEPLDQIQERYLQILGLSEAVFTNPSVSVKPHDGSRMQLRRGTG